MGSLYGFEVKSELPLRRLNAAAGTRGELVVAKAPRPLMPPDREPTGLRVTDDGYRWFASYELDGGECLLQMPPTGSFLLQPARGRIVVESTDEDAELLEHRIASAAICTLLSMREDLVLHAAAVEAGGRAVVFCGPSQRGKSTLAQALAETGCRLLGEDGIAIELGGGASIAQPGARGVRIRRRDGNGRLRPELLTDPGPGEPSSCPVAAVVLLGERGAAFEVEPLPPARALALLTPNLIHSGGRPAIAAAFQRLAVVLSRVPASRVSLADDLGLLAAGAAGLLDAAGVDG
jgi:hypothetical protein